MAVSRGLPEESLMKELFSKAGQDLRNQQRCQCNWGLLEDRPLRSGQGKSCCTYRLGFESPWSKSQVANLDVYTIQTGNVNG